MYRQRTLLAVMLCLLASSDVLLAWCLLPSPPIDRKRSTSQYGFDIDFDFYDDGARDGRPELNSKECIEDGFAAWHGRAGLNVQDSNPTNVTVQADENGQHNTNPNAFSGYADPATGTIWLPRDILRLSEFNCLRINKLIQHEFGHILGLGHPTGWTTWFSSVMLAADPTKHLGGIDEHPEFPTCGDEGAVERAQYFEGPGPIAWGDIGGIAGCGPNEWSDESGCCHEIGSLLFASAVGHLNRKPEIHFRVDMPAQNQTFAPFSTINFAVHTLDSDGSVYRVDYHVSPAGGTPFVIYTGGFPFSMSASNVPPGTYDVQAVAYDTAQEYTMSEVRRVIVLPPAPNTPNNLLSGVVLGVNEYRISPNGLYSLWYQTDGNLVLYGPGWVPIVWTGTSGSPAGTYMNPSGNLEVYNAGPSLVWQSLTGGGANGGSHLTVKDDGHIAIVRPNGTQVVQWP